MNERVPLRIVLDTNVLLVSISSRSRYHWIYRSLFDGRYELLITNEILTEYEEIVARKLGAEIAKDVVRALLLAPNVHQVDAFFQWDLIKADPDDNKFVDCAIAAGGHAIVTEDRHFKVLDDVRFPAVRQIGIAAFAELLESWDAP